MRSTVFARALRNASVVIMTFASAVIQPACAQGDAAASYPTKPLRVIVGFAAGGGNDMLWRIIGPKLSENIGQPVLIENRTGAGGRLAVEYAQRQPPDGYTLVAGATGQMSVASAIYPNLTFHPTRTLTPLTMIASYPLILAISMNDTIKSVKDLVAWAKANPGRSNYPTSSPAFTIPAELFKLKTGMPAEAIPYKSTSEMILSVVSGQTLFAFTEPSFSVPQVQGGRVRALAITGSVRSSELPDVPTMAEAGLADVDFRLQWCGAFVIAATPPVIARKLEAELRRVLADPVVRGRIKAKEYDPGGGSGDEFRRMIDADIKVFSDVIKAANLKLE